MLSIDAGLSTYGLNPSRYLQAAAIAQYYYNNYEGKIGEDDWKAAAQIATWEILFDSTFNLSSGGFRTISYNSRATSIWNAVKSSIPDSSDQWVLAVNPTISVDDTVGVSNYQNFLVRYAYNPPPIPDNKVPEPSSLLLFGLGLLSLAAVSRKKE